MFSSPGVRSIATAAALLAAGGLGVLRATAGASPRAVAPSQDVTPTRDFPATLRAATTTATAAAIAVSPTVTAYIATARAGTAAALTITPAIGATITATATLPPAFGTVDPCSCLRPTPNVTECASIIATLYAGYGQAFATQTALARGTDTATPTPSDTPTATATATVTPEPPTAAPTPLPTATRTTEPTPTARPVWRAYVPMLIVRRGRR